MNRVIVFGLGMALVSFLSAGCSESESTKVETTSRPMLSVFEDDPDSPGTKAERSDFADSELPAIVGAAFEPDPPLGGERLRVVPSVEGGVTSIRFDWRLNGVAFGNNAAEIELPTISKGDEITLRMIPLRGVIQGKPFEISQHAKNQRPIITALDIERVQTAGVDSGGAERWRAVVGVGDPDQEAVEIEYRWFVNGLESDEEGDTISLDGMTRGDTIAVHVRATDGRRFSPQAKSGEIVIGNVPPEIVSIPPPLGHRGSFRYVVRASDRDSGDRLEFALRKAPEGMRVSDSDGIVTWQPDAEQAGRHEIEVVVSDGNGGEAVQTFVLSLVATSSEAPAAPR